MNHLPLTKYTKISILKSKQEHIDMVSIINKIWEAPSLKIVKEYVYGNQDDLNRSPTQLEVLNFRIDTESKERNS